jgi:hypothetical protein
MDGLDTADMCSFTSEKKYFLVRLPYVVLHCQYQRVYYKDLGTEIR